MRKKKMSRLTPLMLILANFFFTSKAFAQFSQPQVYGPLPVYGPPPATSTDITIQLLLLLSITLIPIAVIIGLVIYFSKKSKKHHAKEISKIGKP